jgi:hypothetical protein
VLERGLQMDNVFIGVRPSLRRHNDARPRSTPAR